MKIGVIGLGLGVYYVNALNESKFVDNIVLCDTDEEKLASIASKHSKVTGKYRDLDQMLTKEKPDAVCVVTPDHFHRMHAEMCMLAGCHVLLTKPIANSMEDAKSIILTADKHQRKLMLALERRMNANYLKIKQFLDEGVLGEIIQIRFDCIQDKRDQVAKSPWFASPQAGRSSLIGSGIHCVDVISHLVGKPVLKVSAFGNKMGSLNFPKDKTVAAIFQFEGGAVGEVSSTYEAHFGSIKPGEDTFYLVGTKGVATRDRILCDDWAEPQSLPKDDNVMQDSIKRLVDSFVDSLANDKPVLITGREAFKSLAYCNAADEASVKGEIVTPHPIDF